MRNVDSSSETHSPAASDRQWFAMFLLAAVAICLTYALATNHVWEDYLITYRHSENLVEGHGLVYEPGERVHGFTSPINVLLPALFKWMSGSEQLGVPLWLYRVTSMLAWGIGGLIVLRELLQNTAWPRICCLWFALYYLLEAKSVAFTMNGQEAGFMLLFLAGSLVTAHRGVSNQWIGAGVCWSGLMWTRPDGFVYIGAIALAAVVFCQGQRKVEWFGILKAGAVCAILYAPWFAWAWWYYGSPIPHTVTAKSSNLVGDLTDPVLLIERVLGQLPVTFRMIFSPIYGQTEGWPYWVIVQAFFCGVFCATYWLIPAKSAEAGSVTTAMDGTETSIAPNSTCSDDRVPSENRLGRMASLVFTITCGYIACTSLSFAYPWYLPPIALCGAIVLSGGIGSVAERLAPTFGPKLANILNALVAAAMFVVLVMTVWQMRIQQQEIEFGHRMKIGEWLNEHKNPGDRVFLECLGYIGYYSQAKMLDWPGLVSPEVVRERAGLEHIPTAIINLKPEWIVLRRGFATRALQTAAIRESYEPVKIFDVRDRLRKYGYIPGNGYLLGDSSFVVLRKKNSSEASQLTP